MIKVWTDAAEAGFSIVTASAATRLLSFPAFRPRLDATASHRKPPKIHGECNCFSNSDGLRILTVICHLLFLHHSEIAPHLSLFDHLYLLVHLPPVSSGLVLQ